MRSPLSLTLFDKVQDGGGFLRPVTEQLKNSWKRSIRDVGGYWIGTAQWDGTEAEMLDIFQYGMQWEIREQFGGLMTWQGFLAEMELTHKGQTYRRSWTELANRIKVVYSTIGENQVTNNSVETAVWDAYGTPATREQSTAWVTDGTYSAHIVTDAANEGVVIQSSIAIVAGKNYDAHLTVNIVSGTWRLELYRADGTTVIDFSERDEAGQEVMYVGINDDNLIAENIGMRFYCTSASGEAYADAAVFQLAPARAETSWTEDVPSQTAYGTIESILLKAGMTDAAAAALAQTELTKRSYARTYPPRLIDIQEKEVKSRLYMTFLGYAFTLKNTYTTLIGSNNAASTIMSSLISAAEYVEALSIQSNTLSYHVEDREAYRVWDLIRDITNAGDASGNRWTCGVYANRKFTYLQADDDVVARLRGGKLLGPAGELLEGWLAEPGLVALDDMPLGIDAVSGRAADNNRMAWMSEVEFSLPDHMETGQGVKFREIAV